MTEPKSAESLKGKQGLVRLINATRYSLQGIQAGIKHEAAFREELILAIVLIPVALLLPVSTLEKIVLIECTLLVPFAEIINSAIEACVDRFGNEIHPLAGRAKDMGSAGVFFALIIAAIAWLGIAGPVVWSYFS
ncbi:diacylglycerol kinase [Sutterella massiliensis]|uniref:Diacylglycerol kinase n=1 Tax=Sutterella massiliensis TaxID=1816689 RepID=A0ABS2DRY7_9BURK|nr:diacylglycerol kinase [Sutterella massiliensis]MBM6704103.1 diacylglycerol kinase [Sutterella massiliensis]